MEQKIKLYNDDCYKILKQIPDKSVDLVVIDPPYIIENRGAGIYKQEDKKYVEELENIKNGFELSVLEELCRIMKKTNIYIWCSQKQLPIFYEYFVKEKKCNWNLLTWHKSNPIPACGNKYLSDTEYCFFAREKGVKIYGNFNTKFTYYVSPLNVSDKKLYKHPTIKPLNIIENLIINSSNENEVVLDCFMGSGTTGVACKKLNRRFVGIEIDKTYFDIAKDRIEKS